MLTIQFANGRTKTVSERRVLLTFALFFLVVLTLLMIPPGARQRAVSPRELSPRCARRVTAARVWA
jgi:hypothetical protein